MNENLLRTLSDEQLRALALQVVAHFKEASEANDTLLIEEKKNLLFLINDVIKERTVSKKLRLV